MLTVFGTYALHPKRRLSWLYSIPIHDRHPNAQCVGTETGIVCANSVEYKLVLLPPAANPAAGGRVFRPDVNSLTAGAWA